MQTVKPSLFDYVETILVSLHLKAQTIILIRPLAERLQHNDYAARLVQYNAQRMRLRKSDLLSFEQWFKTSRAQALHKKALKDHEPATLEYYRVLDLGYSDYVARFSVHTSRMGRPVENPPEPVTVNAAIAMALTYMCERGKVPPLPEALPTPVAIDLEEATRLRTPEGQLEILYAEEV